MVMSDRIVRQRRVRRRWIVALSALVVLNLAVFTGYLYLRGLHRAVTEGVTVAPEVDSALSPSPTSNREPIVFLVIGSDSREGLPDDWKGDFGSFSGQRADVVMLVQVLPEQGRLQMLSIPRDLRVDIPGHGKNKVNAAFAFGGAELMVETVRATFDIPIHHYVELDFSGFASIVDEVGGVDMTFVHPARDLKSGFSVAAGAQTLNGRQALGYARSRSYQELRGGGWVFVDADDFGRTARQQQIVAAIARSLAGPNLVTDAPGVVSSLARHMVVDSAFREIDFGGVAWAFRSFGAASIDAATLPADGRTIDGVYYAVAKEDDAVRMLAAFRNGASLSLASGVPMRIEILNGNGTSGLAGAWAQWLRERGFDVVNVADADGTDYQVTQVISSPSDTVLAQELATVLTFGEAITGMVPADADILVLLGKDATFPEGSR